MSHRPIAVLDLETTGTDPERDRIIDLAVVYIENGVIGNSPLTYRFNPGIPIPAEATAVHGIKDEDVQAFPPFKEAAQEVSRLLTRVDIAGYAPRLLDLPILAAEFERAGVDWDFIGRVIDVRGIFVAKHPRDLAAAAKVYLGRDHAEAHGALADAIVTAQVFNAQLLAHPDVQAMSRDELARFSSHDNDVIDLAGKLGRDKDGDAVYLFGKNKGAKVRDERSYASWMMGKDFPLQTLRKLQEELNRINGIAPKEYAEGVDQDIPF